MAVGSRWWNVSEPSHLRDERAATVGQRTALGLDGCREAEEEDGAHHPRVVGGAKSAGKAGPVALGGYEIIHALTVRPEPTDERQKLANIQL